MAIELSLFLRRPSATERPETGVTNSVTPDAVAGGGSRLGDALDLAAALGRLHPEARTLWERNAAADPRRRYFCGPEIAPFLELLADLTDVLRGCVNAREGAVHPNADPLLASGVCEEKGGRLVLRRSRHGLWRVLEDLEAVADLLRRADKEGCRVICDFDSDEDDDAVTG